MSKELKILLTQIICSLIMEKHKILFFEKITS